MKSVKIVNMYQNNIVIKNNKNRLRKTTTIWSVVFCVLVFACSYYKIIGGSGADNWYNSVQSVYSPTNELYSDEGSVVFTNNETVLTSSGSFDLPIISGEVSVVNNQIQITPSQTIIVCTPCPGVIEEIGKTNNGTKYIKIKHTTKIYSIVENIETVGVTKGQIVKRGDKIATANPDKTITISIYKNKKMIEGLRVEDNKIVWG